MVRTIVGSSNVRRFYTAGKFQDFHPYKIEFCTVKRMFEVTMDAIEDNSRVIISVVENFIEKAISASEDEAAKKKSLEETMDSFMKTIVSAARKNKKSKFAVAYPIRRPGHIWMTENEDRIRKTFEKSFNSQCQANISKIDCVAFASQVFDQDGVHLTEEAGASFVGNMIGMAEDCFEAEVVELEDDITDKILNLGSSVSRDLGNTAISDLKRKATEMSQWRLKLEKNLDLKFRNDNLMFARLREEIDAEVNRKKEDRTLISGFVDPKLIPTNGKEKIDFLRNCALEFCKKLECDFDGQILFASTSGRPDKGNLMLEFKLDSVDKAREIRKSFAMKRIGNILPVGYEKLQVTTVVTQGTKVRTEILRAIARKIESKTEVGYVPTYLPRPILHIKAKDEKSAPGTSFTPRKHIKTLTFADAIEQYGKSLRHEDLHFAYERASWNFQGQMRQNFVVLKDQNELDQTPRTSGESGSGRGRGGGVPGSYRGGPGRGRGEFRGRGGGTKRSYQDDDTPKTGKFQKNR